MSKVTEEDVRAAYRFLLNREPESDAVVKSRISAHSTISSLRQAFLISPEFLNEAAKNIAIDNSRKEPNSVVVDVDPACLRRLVEHVRRQWTALGASNPHWSVLTHDEYRAENLNEERLQRFYASGEADANLIDVFERRAGRRVSRGRCFELGCGVGRVTKYLAQKFESVVAADISPGNLALCEKHMEESGASNVKPVLLASPYDIDQLGDFDFFYSAFRSSIIRLPYRNSCSIKSCRRYELGEAVSSRLRMRRTIRTRRRTSRIPERTLWTRTRCREPSFCGSCRTTV